MQEKGRRKHKGIRWKMWSHVLMYCSLIPLYLILRHSIGLYWCSIGESVKANLEDSCTVLKRARVADIIDQTHNVTGKFSLRQEIKIWKDFMELKEKQTNVEQRFQRFSTFFWETLMINSGQISELFIWLKCMM